MKKDLKVTLIGLSLVLLSACASNEIVLAPDTQPGDQLKAEYLVGRWCTERELTAKANKEAGHSAITNLEKQFWEFRADGEWMDSVSGWMYNHYGEWRLEGRDNLVLDPKKGNAISYRASFANAGVELHLTDEAEQFLVLGRCD